MTKKDKRLINKFRVWLTLHGYSLDCTKWPAFKCVEVCHYHKANGGTCNGTCGRTLIKYQHNDVCLNWLYNE